MLGKLGFVVFGVGFILLALVPLLSVFGTALPAETGTVGTVLVVIGGIIGAIVTYQKGVARGAARWFLFVAVAVSIVWLFSALGWLAIGGNILVTLLALAFAIAGGLFLLNRK